MDINEIAHMIGDNKRFLSPFEDFSWYCIFPEDSGELEELYFEKLRYAVDHADRLLEQAFNEELFNFYGMNRSKVNSPEEMLSILIFESFVLVPERQTIECCVSNSEFMICNRTLHSVWIN